MSNVHYVSDYVTSRTAMPPPHPAAQTRLTGAAEVRLGLRPSLALPVCPALCPFPLCRLWWW